MLDYKILIADDEDLAREAIKLNLIDKANLQLFEAPMVSLP